MENSNKNSWDEISEDISDVTKKIKDNVSQEYLIDDLKDSFKSTIDASAEILKNLIKAIDETVKDEEIKLESKEVLNKISNELSDIVETTKSKISKLVNDHSSEEE